MKLKITVLTLITFTLLSGALALAQPQLDLTTRTALQRSVEQVYWQHRDWPNQNPGTKPALETLITPEQLQAKAEDGLRLSRALESLWHTSVSGTQLQAELNRMARDSKQPEILGELFAALDSNPAIVAEIIARPVLAERLARNFYQQDSRFNSKTQPFDVWWSKQQSNFAPEVQPAAFAYQLPEIVAPGAPDSWAPTHTLPDANINMTAVWTGAEMIIWGGGTTLAPAFTGSRYDPATDTWHSTNNSAAPFGKAYHTAVWTGTEMIVWGGCDLFRGEHTCDSADGARYNPASDSWVTTSNVGVPHSRMQHTAVWTGTEMIVWGGCSFINDACKPSRVGSGGGRYNPSTDTWTLTNTAGAPEARVAHTAVWTGSQMIVWGGFSDSAPLKSGGGYTPATDTWTATANVSLTARYSHTAVWDGQAMDVWGGTDGVNATNNGARYNPVKNAWKAIPAAGAPSARSGHTAVFTGTEMIVWAGVNGVTPTNTGGRFNPRTNTWTPTSTVNAPPAPLSMPVSVWTGSQMVVWGGQTYTGGRYNPASDTWTPTNAVLTPTGRDMHKAVWTGTEMIVWGGEDVTVVGGTNTGGRYNLALDTWTPTAVSGAPTGRIGHTALWTGTEMIIFGGQSGNVPYKTGGRYNPATNTWKATNTTTAPVQRSYHTAVWTGTEMIVFGGTGLTTWINNGSRYNPSTDTWTALPTTGAPVGRYLHAAVWTGTDMVVWGGATSTGDTNTGARYNLAGNTWTAITTTNAPSARNWTSYVWTGSKMLIWGGQTYNGQYIYHNDGGLYDPASDKWTATSLTGAPSGRGWFGYVWTGTDLLVWGGCGTQGTFCDGDTITGGRYNPVSDSWTNTSTASAPSARDQFPAVWTGSQMIVWGGHDDSGFFLDTTGGIYTPAP